MVFPSLGCLTCKKRRIKCDSARPVCGRCCKASRNCNWESSEDTHIPFRSENTFAGGRPRRPRRPLGSDSPPSKVALRGLSSPLPNRVSLPLELYAFQYWAENFTVWPHDLHDVGYEYGTFALCHWDRVRTGSTLDLAISAFSLAVFGRAMHIDKALEIADKSHIRSIIRMREEIMELSTESLDQLIIATSLMAIYDNYMHRSHGRLVSSAQLSAADEMNSINLMNVCHHRGTASLMLVRQQQGYPQNLQLEKSVRRAIVRTCVLSGVPVQDWLRDGTVFGEEGPALKLDSLIVRVAALRSKVIKILADSCSTELHGTHKLAETAIEAQELSLALAFWSQELPDEWRSSIYCPDTSSDSIKADISYDGCVHVYRNRAYAAFWTKYRAVCLIVHNIQMRLLSILDQRTPHNPSIDAQLEICQKNTNSLATDLCRDVPVFFEAYHSIQGETGSEHDSRVDPFAFAQREILPQMAGIIAWPITVAISAEAVPRTYKQWLLHRLKAITQVIGADVLRSVLENAEVKYQLT